MGYGHSPTVYICGFSFYFYYLMGKLIPKVWNFYQMYFRNPIVYIPIFHQKVEFEAF
jgi:hypothetical protein